jgi:two-component system nitrogen regulation response regulator NtrX
MDEDVLQLLERYLWPGNIRELRNTVERMAILSPDDRITTDAVPLEIRTPPSARGSGLHEVRDSAERDRIRRALEQTDWNVAGAARVLGIERTNLHKRMKALGLNRE